jgi:hypothetical protein
MTTTWHDIISFGDCPECTSGIVHRTHHGEGEPDMDSEADCTECSGSGLAPWTAETASEAVVFAARYAASMATQSGVDAPNLVAEWTRTARLDLCLQACRAAAEGLIQQADAREVMAIMTAGLK